MTASTFEPCFIVPPELLEYVLRTSGDADARDSALATLSVDHAMRASRIQNSLLAVAAPALATGPGAPRSGRSTTLKVRRTSTPPPSSGRKASPRIADQPANQAYDGFGDTYKLYWDIFHRDSIDDSGLPLAGEVHFGANYNNALWDGERMLFGDGDGRIFTGFTGALDVIGHELTHGVTGATIGLRYIGQSGALNESVSDVFGSMVKQYKLGQTSAQADWLIGAGILGPALNGVALRSMKAPGTAFQGDSQPADMSHYVVTVRDNGGVHTNSGIPNRAFYLIATALGGHAWEKAGKVWYHTLTDRVVGSGATFRSFANATVRVARSLYGSTSPEARAVRSGWVQVGVLK